MGVPGGVAMRVIGALSICLRILGFRHACILPHLALGAILFCGWSLYLSLGVRLALALEGDCGRLGLIDGAGSVSCKSERIPPVLRLSRLR